ncbi:MAG: DUF3800 domain-containing protein [Clostridia bacterium]
MNNNIQTIYINLDDSGKLTAKEKITVYGGIVFFTKQEKDKFITQYRSIVNDMKCKYCNNIITCNNLCPELKSSNIKPSDKRRLINYIKNYYTVACIINNEFIYKHIISNKSSKGRYLDYALRLFIKSIILDLIKNNLINPHNPVKLILNVDEQATKSNGYYNLKDGLIEELIHGISNFNYNLQYAPILYNSLDIELSYLKSDKSLVVQAADMIAGQVHNKTLLNQDNYLNFLNIKITLP